MNRRWQPFAITGILALVGLVLCPTQAQSQIRIDGPQLRRSNADSTEGALQPRTVTSKEMLRSLSRANEALKRSDFRATIEIIQKRILNRRARRNWKKLKNDSEDFFVDEEMKQSLKQQAQQMISQLPPEGRRVYEQLYGIAARDAFNGAAQRQGISGFEDVARQFFHTSAGYEATYRMGTYYLDHGQPLAAALCFNRLRQLPVAAQRWEPMLSLKTAISWVRAGMSEEGLRTLQELKEAGRQEQITIGGRTIPWFNRETDALTWLEKLVGGRPETVRVVAENWPMFRGSPSRNIDGGPAVPVGDIRWDFPTIRRPGVDNQNPFALVDAQLKVVSISHRREGYVTIPSAQPLIIGQTVVFRTLENIRAVDLVSGRLLWEKAEMDPVLKSVLPTNSADQAIQATMKHANMLELLSMRSWRNLSIGTLSSDGNFVFALENNGTPYQQRYARNFPIVRPSGESNSSNKLMAFDLVTGEFIWEVGGSRAENEHPLAGVFFLGPPLVLNNQLYCLAESAGEIMLVVLDARTGRGIWVQSLALPQFRLESTPLRKLMGLSPSYNNGVLICPTGAGAIIAIDPARQMLIWGHRYQTNIRVRKNIRTRRFRFMRPVDIDRWNSNITYKDRWHDSSPTIASGHVLLTPRDSNVLYCLSLIEGKLLWKKPRGQGLYLAGIHDGTVVVVGRTQIEAFRLSDGEPVWKEPTPIPMPSGIGFRSGKLYRLPLSTGEIVTVDLDTGRILVRSKMLPGEVPGNLIAAADTIVSQTADSISAYQGNSALTEQIACDLKVSADNADALALRGEMLLHQGNEIKGLDDLRRAIALDSEENGGLEIKRARQLLASTLIDGMRLDFQKYRKHASELENVIDDPQQLLQFLRLHAVGLQKIGETTEAFRQFVKLADPATGSTELTYLDSSRSVRTDRWVRRRIAEGYSKATATERVEMDQTVRQRFEDALKIDEAGSLRYFLSCFADLPIADEARRALVDRLRDDDDAAELELILLRLRSSENRSLAGFATARLVQLFLNHNQYQSAAPLIDELAHEWAEVECIEKKTGRKLVDEWLADEQLATTLNSALIWPDRHFEVKHTPRGRPVSLSMPITIVGPRPKWFDDWSLEYHERTHSLIARDGDGNKKWVVSTQLPDEKVTVNRATYSFGNFAYIRGHLMVVVLGNRFYVIDALSGKKTAKLLWRHDLTELDSDGLRKLTPLVRPLPNVGGGRRNISQVRGRAGPITDDLICYQIGTRLYAADPLTGKVLWIRRNVARGSRVIGDAEYLFVIRPGMKSLQILRSSDGKKIGERGLPKTAYRIYAHGRHILFRQIPSDSSDKSILSNIDLLTEKTEWKIEVSSEAKIDVVEGEELAVLEPDGHFSLYKLDDGALQFESKLEPIEKPDRLIDIAVRRSRDRYTLLTNTQNLKEPRFRIGSGSPTSRSVNGYAYGFDRKTQKKIWTRRITRQSVDVRQPQNIPVLVFAAKTVQRIPQVRKRPRVRGLRRFSTNRTSVSIEILDTRNGRIVYKLSGPISLSPFQVTMDRDEKIIKVASRRSQFEISLSETPLSEPLETKTEKIVPPSGRRPSIIEINIDPPKGIKSIKPKKTTPDTQPGKRRTIPPGNEKQPDAK